MKARENLRRWQRIATLAMMLTLPSVGLSQDAPDGPSGSPGDLAPTPALETARQTADEARAELDAVRQSISLNQARAEELRNEIAAMDGDRARQNAALIAAAQRVKLAEIEVSAIEEQLAAIRAEETEVRARLDGANVGMANLLAAIQRIGKSPPPALVVDPDDALGSARSALLLSAILPQLRERSDAVIADLGKLRQLKEQALAEETELKANYATLLEEQLRIATLIEARRRGVEIVSADLAAQEREAESLARRASSLDQLIESLTARIEAVTAAAEAAAAAEQGGKVPELSPETVRLALANTDRSEPAIPFEAARGYMTMPAAGVPVTEFGADDGFGGISNGLYVVTRGEAQVVAPVDGWVMYKGPYLNYGQIVILNPGQGYSILLAGLDTTSVDLGQFVLMGEPVGTMGSRTEARAVTTNAGVSRPTLYIELRNQDTPVDPTPWWRRQDPGTQSG